MNCTAGWKLNEIKFQEYSRTSTSGRFKQKGEQYTGLGSEVLEGLNQVALFDNALTGEPGGSELLKLAEKSNAALAAKKSIINTNNAILVTEAQRDSLTAVLSSVPDLAKPEKFGRKIKETRLLKKPCQTKQQK